MNKAYFAGGCFWCITPIYARMAGVQSVRCGYSGGDEEHPSYLDVKHQNTGHRETICICYDPELVSFERLLDEFLLSVDPFDPGGQFIDRGHSYTLAIYYTSEEERLVSARKLQEFEQDEGKRPCIALEPFKSFFEAEEEHQNFFEKNPEAFEQELLDSGRKNK